MLYQFNNQHSCFDWFIYGNDLAKVRLLLPALLCIMVQTTFAVAKIWYLFDNAKYFSSHVRYNHKISCISEEIEHVQKWTFSIAISISPKSIIALKRLTLLAFRKFSNVISAFCIIPLSNSAALFVPGNKGCLGVTQCLPSNMARFVNEVSVKSPCLTMMMSSQFPFCATKALRRLRSVLL